MNSGNNSESVSTEYIREHAKIYLEKVKALSAKKLRREISPELSFNLNGTSALGLANWVENRIYINVDILRHNVRELQDTVIHEYCHLLDKHIYDEFGHGKTWKKLMSLLGGNPNAKVNDIDVTAVPKSAPAQIKYLYTCPCKTEYYISEKEHKNVQNKIRSYGCKKCKKEIFFVKRVLR